MTVKIPTFTESSGVGYYADIDGNGSVDGIIFEDFKVGGSGTWGNANGKYTIPTVSETKNYYISKKSYTDKFGTKDVLTPIGTGNNRFYVMTLTDKISNYCEWAPAKEQATNGWNLPTRNELAAFSGMLNITISNRGTYGLHGYYWTSEGYGLSGAWVASYEGGYMRTISASGGAYVRLCRTF